VDRVPFDFFDEAGDLFVQGRYDPSLRQRLTYGEQVQARARFHKKYRTDLIFDCPVLIPPASGCRITLTHEGRELASLDPAYSSATGMAWNAMPPPVIGPGLLAESASGIVVKHIEWGGGWLSEEALDLATGTTDVTRTLFQTPEQLIAGLPCIDGDWGMADYSLAAELRRAVGPDVMLSGTILDPFSAASWYLGLEPLMLALYDDPIGVGEAIEAMTLVAIRAGVEMVRRGLDMVRIGAAACCLLSPDLYRRFALPAQKELIRAIQGTGGIVHLHLCGKVKHLLGLLPETGALVLETITPPPLGDTLLAEAKAALGDKMCLKGNLSPTGALRSGTVRQCLAEAEDCLAVGAPGGGFIFSVADNLAPGTPEENVAAVAELLHG
jgi:hypothetical protein